MSEPDESGHVARIIRTLELLAAAPRTQADLARSLEAHPRTVLRLLNRLVAEGYVERRDAERREYLATMKIVTLAGAVMEQTNIMERAIPFVRRLRDEIGETTLLGVLQGGRLVPVIVEPGKELVSARPRLGETLPSHASAAGKALLAYLATQLDEVLIHPLERYTDKTIVDPGEFLIHLATVRQHGYAAEDCEHSADVRGAAATVFDESATAIAALAVQGPAHRVSTESLSEIGGHLAQAATTLSADLGFYRDGVRARGALSWGDAADRPDASGFDQWAQS